MDVQYSSYDTWESVLGLDGVLKFYGSSLAISVGLGAEEEARSLGLI